MVKQPITVGIVDDDSATRYTLERILSFKGFQTELYASAEEFINAASSLDYILVTPVRETA
jgi:FixJ family two-component response regulator